MRGLQAQVGEAQPYLQRRSRAGPRRLEGCCRTFVVVLFRGTLAEGPPPRGQVPSRGGGLWGCKQGGLGLPIAHARSVGGGVRAGGHGRRAGGRRSCCIVGGRGEVCGGGGQAQVGREWAGGSLGRYVTSQRSERRSVGGARWPAAGDGRHRRRRGAQGAGGAARAGGRRLEATGAGRDGGAAAGAVAAVRGLVRRAAGRSRAARARTRTRTGSAPGTEALVGAGHAVARCGGQ